MVSTHLKNISRIGNLFQIGVKIKNYLKPPPSKSHKVKPRVQSCTSAEVSRNPNSQDPQCGNWVEGHMPTNSQQWRRAPKESPINGSTSPSPHQGRKGWLFVFSCCWVFFFLMFFLLYSTSPKTNISPRKICYWEGEQPKEYYTLEN